MLKIFIKLLFFFFIATFNVKAAKVENINVVGNDRISKDTILMFSKIDLDKDIDNDVLNTILKNLYDTNFFEDVEVSISNDTLFIKVKESPIIDQISIEGVKNNKLKDLILDNLYFKPRYYGKRITSIKNNKRRC